MIHFLLSIKRQIIRETDQLKEDVRSLEAKLKLKEAIIGQLQLELHEAEDRRVCYRSLKSLHSQGRRRERKEISPSFEFFSQIKNRF